MVEMIVLSLLGGGLFAQCARAVFAVDSMGIGLALWAIGGAGSFWALQTHQKSRLAREKYDKEALAKREQATAEIMDKLDKLTAQTAAGFTDVKTGVTALGSKADNLLANQPQKDKLEPALETIASLKEFCNQCDQSLTGLKNAVDAFAEQTGVDFQNCQTSLASLDGRAEDLVNAQPAKCLVETGLNAALAVNEFCKNSEKKASANTTALKEVAGQLKSYNDVYLQKLRETNGQLSHFMNLLKDNYNLLREIGEQYT